MLIERLTAALRTLCDHDFVPITDEDTKVRQRMFHPPGRLIKVELATTQTTITDDLELIQRIIRAYHKSQALQEHTGSFWSNYFGGLKRPIHDILMSGDISSVTRALRNPIENNLFYGFDGICATYAATTAADNRRSGNLNYDLLVRLGEALGALRLDYPEAKEEAHPRPFDVNTIIDRIERRLGFEVCFPNPYPGERGIASNRGVISYRAMHALFQANLVKQTLHDTLAGKSILEIGAGLGRTAYYASLFGICKYTIIDLPLTNVAQAYFLGRTLGPHKISLFGEPETGPVRILPPQAFFGSTSCYDIALNADLLTQMSRETAEQYLSNLSTRTKILFSINHEFNPFTVQELCSAHRGWKVERYPYWLRKGYALETISFANR